MQLIATFEELTRALARETMRHYGERLVSLVLFGSVARGTPGPESDVDFLVVANDLPRGRIPRVAEFAKSVEVALEPALQGAQGMGIFTRLSPIFKTREEVALGSPLFLDMTEEAILLFDRDDFFALRLDALRRRLAELGSKRIRAAGGWYWLLKPDLQPGEVFEL